MFARSKAWRVAAVSWNRTTRAGQEPRTRVRPLNQRAEHVASAMLSELIEDVDDRVPVVVFVPPAGGRPRHVKEARARVVDFRDEAFNDLERIPDLQLLHPGRHAYAWYAQKLAQALIDASCVTEPGTPAPCRLERAAPGEE